VGFSSILLRHTYVIFVEAILTAALNHVVDVFDRFFVVDVFDLFLRKIDIKTMS
jgi:hypothetical protein